MVCVEPDSDNFAQCCENLSPYGDRVKICNAAVGPVSGSCAVDQSTATEGLEFARQFKALPEGEAGIRVLTVPECFSFGGVDSFDLVKIDIEGAELELFSGNCKWLYSVRNLVIEIHGAPARSAVETALESFDYEHCFCHELDIYLNIRPRY